MSLGAALTVLSPYAWSTATLTRYCVTVVAERSRTATLTGDTTFQDVPVARLKDQNDKYQNGKLECQYPDCDQKIINMKSLATLLQGTYKASRMSPYDLVKQIKNMKSSGKVYFKELKP